MSGTQVVSSIRVYPIKSAGGLALAAATIGPHGFEHDRRWILADAGGRFISQRTVPRMALLRPEIVGNALRVHAPGMPTLALPLRLEAGEATRVQVWGDACDARAADAEAAAWFSEALGLACRAVYLPEDSLRIVDPDYAEAGDRVGFADGFPFLLTSEASLDALNAHGGMQLPMDRFRPNLVVAGAGAFAEDGWRRIRIGAVGFRVVKPCARCSVTTVDQATAEVGKEPLVALATLRKVGAKVLFGQHLIHDGRGELRVGDRIVVEERAPARA